MLTCAIIDQIKIQSCLPPHGYVGVSPLQFVLVCSTKIHSSSFPQHLALKTTNAKMILDQFHCTKSQGIYLSFSRKIVTRQTHLKKHFFGSIEELKFDKTIKEKAEEKITLFEIHLHVLWFSHSCTRQQNLFALCLVHRHQLSCVPNLMRQNNACRFCLFALDSTCRFDV